jgi:hypothetical protein
MKLQEMPPIGAEIGLKRPSAFSIKCPSLLTGRIQTYTIFTEYVYCSRYGFSGFSGKSRHWELRYSWKGVLLFV